MAASVASAGALLGTARKAGMGESCDHTVLRLHSVSIIQRLVSATRRV